MNAFFDRAYVESVIREVATEVGVSFEHVAHLSRRADATEARRLVVMRIAREKGCRATTLAAVWGCDPKHILALIDREPRRVVVRAAERAKPPPIVVKPRSQIEERLRWAHGEERAAQIIGGNDIATQQDLAAWRGLGSGRARA